MTRIDGLETRTRQSCRCLRPVAWRWRNRSCATIAGTVGTCTRTHVVPHLEIPVNKRKKVALRKHRIKRKKMEEKRRLSGLARRK